MAKLAMAVFNRDTTTGELTFVETVVDGSNGVSGMISPYGVEVSPDSSHLYVSVYDLPNGNMVAFEINRPEFVIFGGGNNGLFEVAAGDARLS